MRSRRRAPAYLENLGIRLPEPRRLAGKYVGAKRIEGWVHVLIKTYGIAVHQDDILRAFKNRFPRSFESITNPGETIPRRLSRIRIHALNRAMFLINEIGPVARFSSPKKLVSYAGLAPSTHQSGNHTTHGPITKEGNNHIRWILIEERGRG